MANKLYNIVISKDEIVVQNLHGGSNQLIRYGYLLLILLCYCRYKKIWWVAIIGIAEYCYYKKRQTVKEGSRMMKERITNIEGLGLQRERTLLSGKCIKKLVLYSDIKDVVIYEYIATITVYYRLGIIIHGSAKMTMLVNVKYIIRNFH
jgi:ACT domain-containing protein